MNLLPKHIKAITLLASWETCQKVANEVSVSPQTISEWKKQPEFTAELNKMQMESLRSARIKIQQSSVKAVDSLTEIAQASSNDETRRKAALDILRLAGYEPGSQETYAWGIGPRTEADVQEKWEQEESTPAFFRI